MTTGLEKIKGHMAAFLQAHDVNALTAWPKGARVHPDRPVAVVSLRGCKIEPAGFQNYMGERLDPATQQLGEVYGRRARLCFGLDLFGAVGLEDEMEQSLERLVQALLLGGPEGLCVEEFSCGEREYDQKERLQKRVVEVVCTAYLHTITQTDGLFLDFEIKGGIMA